jgi:hypothetical protein
MAETPEDLQKQLNIFHDYCLAWKLKVNIDKTKIVCFTNGRLPQTTILPARFYQRPSQNL